MSDILDFINSNAALMNLLFSFVVAGATVFYALLTRALVSETRRMRQVQTEPAISVTVEPSEHGLNFINFTIQNIGQGAAHSVTLRAEPNFQRGKGRYIGDLGLFKHGIRYLAPKQRLTFFLTSILDDVHGPGEDLSRLNFTVYVKYKSSLGDAYEEQFPINFEEFDGFGTIGTPPLISIADDLRKIEREIGSFASGFKKLNVITETRAEVRAEYQQMVEERQARRLRDSQASQDDDQGTPELPPASSSDGQDPSA